MFVGWCDCWKQFTIMSLLCEMSECSISIVAYKLLFFVPLSLSTGYILELEQLISVKLTFTCKCVLFTCLFPYNWHLIHICKCI